MREEHKTMNLHGVAATLTAEYEERTVRAVPTPWPKVRRPLLVHEDAAAGYGHVDVKFESSTALVRSP